MYFFNIKLYKYVFVNCQKSLKNFFLILIDVCILEFMIIFKRFGLD